MSYGRFDDGGGRGGGRSDDGSGQSGFESGNDGRSNSLRSRLVVDEILVEWEQRYDGLEVLLSSGGGGSDGGSDGRISDRRSSDGRSGNSGSDGLVGRSGEFLLQSECLGGRRTEFTTLRSGNSFLHFLDSTDGSLPNFRSDLGGGVFDLDGGIGSTNRTDGREGFLRECGCSTEESRGSDDGGADDGYVIKLRLSLDWLLLGDDSGRSGIDRFDFFNLGRLDDRSGSRVDDWSSGVGDEGKGFRSGFERRGGRRSGCESGGIDGDESGGGDPSGSEKTRGDGGELTICSRKVPASEKDSVSTLGGGEDVLDSNSSTTGLSASSSTTVGTGAVSTTSVSPAGVTTAVAAGVDSATASVTSTSHHHISHHLTNPSHRRKE